ncbi:MAG: DUF4886 domain-containing protein [Clostridia bacterium]|nr:DUF4886 domain-containing protein [Clostridia bacterium]
MKVLSIGNSFSQDAHRWLHTMADYDGVDLQTVNLYIGGCSLQMHWDNLRENLPAYDLERNGGPAEGKISIADALKMEDWDVVTLQQASPDCGFYESYQPYLRDLTAVVREACPGARLYFHQTWAYEHGATHPAFARYGHDQADMYRRHTACAQRAAAEMEASLIPAGLVIQTLRETVPAFDYKNGGMTLCRDGYHLTLDYGRYAAAATWYRVLLGGTAKAAAFPAFQAHLLNRINAVIGQLL